MQIPGFIKEVVWSLYPPRYRQLANKNFSQSLRYLSRMLLIAFVIAGLILLPKIALMKDQIQDELGKFEVFKITGEVTQNDAIAIPATNPWVRVDLNSNLTLTREIFVVDKETVQYRFLGIKSLPREQLKEPSTYSPRVSGFFFMIILFMLPGIALLLYVRLWLKYLLMILAVGTFFFLIMELSKLRLKWKQMLNIGAHALTVVILVEVISSAFSTAYLMPVLRFLGVNIYAASLILYAVLMVVGIVGYHMKK